MDDTFDVVMPSSFATRTPRRSGAARSQRVAGERAFRHRPERKDKTAGSSTQVERTSCYQGLVRSFLSRLLRAVKALARDGRIPRPLRWLAAFAILPIPGPLDEAALIVVGVIMLAFYRDAVREAWGDAPPSEPRRLTNLTVRDLPGLEPATPLPCAGTPSVAACAAGGDPESVSSLRTPGTESHDA